MPPRGREDAVGYLGLAIASAALLGVWAFGLGLYRDRVSVYAVMLVSATAAGVAYLIIGGTLHELAFDRRDVPAGLLGGALNFTGTVLLLTAYQRGKIGVVSGVAAANVVVPLAYSLALGEQITARTATGTVVLLGGLAMFYAAGMGRRGAAADSASTGAILLALGAALFWGFAIIVLDIGSRISVTSTLAISEVPQVTLALVIIAFASAHSLRGVTARVAGVLVVAGLLLALGQIAFFTAANAGDIGVVSVIASLSPLVTALLALAVFRERMARLERLALLVVVAGTGLVLA